MGGVAGITMILGMIRTKFAAVLIGTGGVGLLASFNAIQGLIGTLAGLGIGSSAVRDVAVAVAKNDQRAVGRAVLTLRRMCWLTGALGLLTMVALSPLIGQLTFESNEHNYEIASLGLIILFGNISGGQMALIQGSRRIGDMARATIVSAVVATVITIGFYLWLGLRGIVPGLVLSAAVQLIISWQFAKRVPVPAVGMTWHESFKEAGSMVKLGVAMMWTGLAGSLVSYATVTIITNQYDLHAVGIYTAAFALSGIFVNFVLNAMGADYYPRISGLAGDAPAMNTLINQQIEVGLLIATPGLLLMIVCAPWLIEIFYTQEFGDAYKLLQWFLLGCFGRVVGFPFGYALMADKKTGLFFLTQTVAHGLHVLLIWLGLILLGLEGVSVAFATLYIVAVTMNYVIARHIRGFLFSRSVVLLLLNLIFVLFGVFVLQRYVDIRIAQTVGLLIGLLLTIISFRNVVRLVGDDNPLIRGLLKLPGVSLLAGLKS